MTDESGAHAEPSLRETIDSLPEDAYASRDLLEFLAERGEAGVPLDEIVTVFVRAVTSLQTQIVNLRREVAALRGDGDAGSDFASGGVPGFETEPSPFDQ